MMATVGRNMLFLSLINSVIRHILIVLLTVVTPPSSYYTQRGWYISNSQTAIDNVFIDTSTFEKYDFYPLIMDSQIMTPSY